jgi:hypothetical protein
MDLGRLRGCLLIDGHICAVQGRFVGIFIRLFLLNNFRCLCIHFLVTTVNILYGNRNKKYLLLFKIPSLCFYSFEKWLSNIIFFSDTILFHFLTIC